MFATIGDENRLAKIIFALMKRAPGVRGKVYTLISVRYFVDTSSRVITVTILTSYM